MDPRDARDPRLLPRPHARSAAGSQEMEWGARRDAALVADAERVLGAPVPRGLELHPPPRGGAARPGRRRPDHVGQRLPAPRGLLAVHARAPAPRVRRRRPPTRCAAMVGGNAARVYGFDLDALAPIARRCRPDGRRGRPPTRFERHPRRESLRCPAFALAKRREVSRRRRAWDASGTPPERLNELRNREVQATSVGAWATSLVAIYETDPDIIAAVLPPPLEPPERAARARDDRDRRPGPAGHAAVRRRHVRGGRRATRAPSAATRCSCR